MKRILTVSIVLFIMAMNVIAQNKPFCIAKDGKTYHRVKIGPYASRSEVDTLLPKIKALPGMGGSFITSK